jgi:hypothetical protein
MAVNFRSLLSVKADDVKAPSPLPEGTYHGNIDRYEFGESQNKKTPYIRYTVKLHSSGEDVAQEDLEGIELSSRKLTQDFYLTTDALYRLKDFIASLGIQTEGRTLEELIPETVNMSVVAYVIQRMNPEKPEEPPRNNIRSLKGESEG